MFLKIYHFRYPLDFFSDDMLFLETALPDELMSTGGWGDNQLMGGNNKPPAQGPGPGQQQQQPQQQPIHPMNGGDDGTVNVNLQRMHQQQQQQLAQLLQQVCGLF